MSIYIFDPAGAGGSQDLQTTLSNGANLTSSFATNVNGFWNFVMNSWYCRDNSTRFGFLYDAGTQFLQIGDTTGGNTYNLTIDYGNTEMYFLDRDRNFNNGKAVFHYYTDINANTYVKYGDFINENLLEFHYNKLFLSIGAGDRIIYHNNTANTTVFGRVDINDNFISGYKHNPNVSLYFRAPNSMSIINQTDTYAFVEDTGGSGKVTFQGTGYVSATAGGSSGQHLVVIVNGNTRKIPLFFP